MSDETDRFPLSAHPDIVIPTLQRRVTELEERLELWATTGDGKRIKTDIGDCDGIGCRNETIKLQDERIEKLVKWRDKLLVDCAALAKQLRDLKRE